MSDPADLTDLEAAALRMLLYGDYPALAHLREQLETCRVAKRTMTGAGFYTDLDCAANPPPRLVFHATLGGVYAEIAGLEHGAGFVLWIEGGRLATLECFTYVGVWPEEVTGFELEYLHQDDLHTRPGGQTRDWAALEHDLMPGAPKQA